MKIVGAIPARFASTRFPGKPLAKICGEPLIQHVIRRAQLASSLSAVIVATDHRDIAAAAAPFCSVVMTRDDHPTGADRIAEALESLDCDGIVNIQGDEPLMDPNVIDQVADDLSRFPMSSAATPIREAADIGNPNIVKVVIGGDRRALYFSRSPIPFLRNTDPSDIEAWLASFPFLQHLGIYGYRRDTLTRIVNSPMSPLEKAECLEQLRALELGIEIGVARVESRSIGVDTPGDIERVEAILKGK